MYQIVCPLGLRPRPHWGSLQRSPDSLAGLGGGASGKRKEEGEGGSGGEGRWKGWGGEERGGSPGMPKSTVGKPTSIKGVLEQMD